jgi:hypothetical protein
VAARFSLFRTEAFALTRGCASYRTGRPNLRHQKRSQFRFEVPARIAFPGGRCRKGRCDCSPASRKRFEGTLMSGPQVLLPELRAPAAECHSTSFKHALYWLMRNLLKITRVASAVNIRGQPALVSTTFPALGKDSLANLSALRWGALPRFPDNHAGTADYASIPATCLRLFPRPAC